MGAGSIALTGLRVLVVLGALGVVGLGAWSKVIIHDIEIRGSIILDMVTLPPASEDAWRSFFAAVLGSPIRVWIAIAAGSFVSLATTLILLSTTLERLRISAALLLPLEFLSMLASAASLGATLSLDLKLEALRARTLDASSSPDLRGFSMLFPLMTAYATLSGALLFLALCASLAATLHACHRARDSKACSFEPTASALGMGHGYQAVRPQTLRDAIPTLYDPKKPIPEGSVGDEKLDFGFGSADEEMGFADKGADMGSGVGVGGVSAGVAGKAEGEISGPLGLERPERVQQIRAARPWSEMPKRK